MLRKKLRGKIIKKQLFLEECINLYKNNSTSESHRFNYVKIVSYRNLPTEPKDVQNVKQIFSLSPIDLFRSVKAQVVKRRSLFII
jgi:hypothetical protein